MIFLPIAAYFYNHFVLLEGSEFLSIRRPWDWFVIPVNPVPDNASSKSLVVDCFHRSRTSPASFKCPSIRYQDRMQMKFLFVIFWLVIHSEGFPKFVYFILVLKTCIEDNEEVIRYPFCSLHQLQLWPQHSKDDLFNMY